MLHLPTEFAFLGCAFLSLGATTWAATQSREYLFAVLVTLTVLTSLTAGYLVTFLGWTISFSTALYGGVYLGLDALAESYRKIDAQRAVYYALLSNALLMGVAALLLATELPATEFAVSVRTVFGFVPQVVLSGLVAFAIASRIEIDLFAWVRKRYKQKTAALALRNNVSTVLAQGIDAALFFTLGFYGTVSGAQLWQLILTGWLLRIAVALLDTPLLYFIRWRKASSR